MSWYDTALGREVSERRRKGVCSKVLVAGRSQMMPIVGLACCLAWSYVTNLGDETLLLANHVGQAASLVALALFCAIRKQASCCRRGPCAIAAALMAALAGSLAFDLVPGVRVLLALVGGTGCSYLFCAWFEAYCRQPLGDAMGRTMLAVALAGALRFLLVPLDEMSVAVVAGVLALLPLASAACLAVGSCMVGEAAGAYGVKDAEGPVVGRLPPAAALVEFATYGLAFGALRTGMGTYSSQPLAATLGYGLRVAVPLLLWWWLSLRARGGQGAGRGVAIAQWCVAATAMLLLFGVFLGGATGEVLSAVTLAARGLVSLLVYLRAFDLVRRLSMHPCVAYGMLRSAYEVAFVGGLLVYRSFGEVMLANVEALDVIGFVVSCALILLLLGFMRALRLPMGEGLEVTPGEGAAQASAVPGVEDLFEERVADLAQAHGLSTREAEVMRLTLRGHTKRRIAEELCLSEDTIRYHAKQLYRKLDVHSRQELLDLAEDAWHRHE